MASRSGKNSRTSSTKNEALPQKQHPKNRQRKTGSKKRTARKKKKKSGSKKGLVLILALLAMVSLVAFGYYLGQQDHTPYTAEKTKTTVSHKKAKEQREPSMVFAKVKTKRPEKERVRVPVKTEPQPEVTKEKGKVALAYRGKKPKLAIIIDDVSNAGQLKRIISLHISITPSIFPPSHLSMRSHTLARGLKH